MKTFPRGVHPKSFKELSQDCAICEMPAPKIVAIPVAQHVGAPAKPVVAKGDAVVCGQLIAEAASFVSCNIFSSVSGKVVNIIDKFDASGNKVKHIVIENDGLDTMENLPILNDPTAAEIIAQVKEAGICGMGGAGFPTHVKLSPKTPVDTLIINGAECEPYITCDYRIMLEYAKELIEGSLLLAKALGLSQVHIGIEKNKPLAIAHLQAYIEEAKIAGVIIDELEVKYPQGAERQIACAVTGREIPATSLPGDYGVLISNVHTALSTYYAVVKGEKLTKRVLTVSGKGIKHPANMWVRVGTSFEDIIDYLGGESETPAVKLISGGPMMGRAVANEKASSSKITSCVLLLSKEEAPAYYTMACINCGRCAKICPMGVMPMFVDRDVLASDFEGAKYYNAHHCIECGSCSYVCPAKRPLVQSVALARKTIREKGI